MMQEGELAEVPYDLLTLRKGVVRHLSIQSAYLQSLPRWINRLAHLETLQLDGSSFGGKRLDEGATAFPLASQDAQP
jgi:hypothetical protein